MADFDLASAILGGLIGIGLRATLPLVITEMYVLWKQRHGEAA
jgi:hypothetical protein